MKISDLADLVVVRNHINVVIEAMSSVRRTEKGDSDKTEFRTLNNTRVKLDQRFVDAIKELDLDNLFPSEYIKASEQIRINTDGDLSISSPSVIKTSSPTPYVDKAVFSSQYSQMSLPLTQINTTIVTGTDGVWEDVDTPPDHPEDTVEGRDLIHETKPEDPEAAELALIAERVKAQKEQLKKEGRSNKRVSKAKEDVAAK